MASFVEMCGSGMNLAEVLIEWTLTSSPTQGQQKALNLICRVDKEFIIWIDKFCYFHIFLDARGYLGSWHSISSKFVFKIMKKLATRATSSIIC